MRDVLDPMTRDESALAFRAEEDAREQRWAEFTLDCSRWGHQRVAEVAVHLYRWKDTPLLAPTGLQTVVLNFQETEGWSGVFAALARAIKEQEPDTAEMERRR